MKYTFFIWHLLEAVSPFCILCTSFLCLFGFVLEHQVFVIWYFMEAVPPFCALPAVVFLVLLVGVGFGLVFGSLAFGFCFP